MSLTSSNWVQKALKKKQKPDLDNMNPEKLAKLAKTMSRSERRKYLRLSQKLKIKNAKKQAGET